MPAPPASREPAPSRHLLGVDENGLGSRLGPLLVTAVYVATTEAGEARVRRRPKGQLAEDLDDSKRLLKHGSVALGEAWARAVVERLAPAGARAPTHPDELVAGLSLESRAVLRAPCPRGLEAHCWGTEGERFQAPEALLDRVRAHLDQLERQGVVLRGARSSIVCTEQLNLAKERGVNRFVRNLHAMEALVLALREQAPAEVHAVCGKVGGIGEYSRYFGPLSQGLHSTLMEGRARSAYHFPGLGELHFVRDADADDHLVMLASMLGKYLRELLMARITRYYGAGTGGVAGCSGYNDQVTDRFVHGTTALRRERGVPDRCFERARAERTRK